MHWNMSFSLFLCLVLSCSIDFCTWFLYFGCIFVHTHINRLELIMWVYVCIFIYVSFYNSGLNSSHGKNSKSVLCSLFLFFHISRILSFICSLYSPPALSNFNIHWSYYGWIQSSISVFGYWKRIFSRINSFQFAVTFFNILNL